MVVGFTLELVVEIGTGAARGSVEVRKEFEDSIFETSGKNTVTTR